MKKIKFILNLIIFLFFILFNQNYAFAQKSDFLSAKIEKINGKYYITRISNYYPLTFDIKNLTPQFDTKTYQCQFSYKKPVKNNSGDPLTLCEEDETTFRKNKAAIGDTIFVHVFTAGLGTLTGYNLRESFFDKEEFEKALKESFENTEINREELLKMYDEIISNITRVHNNYSTYLKNFIEFEYTTSDNSGFFKNDIDFKKLNLYRIKNISTIHKINVDFNPLEENYKNYFKRLSDKTKNEIDNLYNYPISFNKPYFTHENYNIEISTDKNKILYLHEQKQKINLNLNIISKDFKKVYPIYSNEDSRIKFYFDGKGIYISNKTSNFVQIKSIAIYYNNAVNTIGDIIIEIPPNSQLRDPISIELFENSNIQQNNSYTNMTLEIAKNKKVSFGFAVKYRLIEQNIDKTLYKLNSYNLADILKKI